MPDFSKPPGLKSLHSDSSLDSGKLEKIRKLSTDSILKSLLAGDHCLKTPPDGTILDGHHRVYVLREREVEVDNLPRDVIAKDQE